MPLAPQYARLRALLAVAAVLLLIAVAVTADAPRSRLLVGVIVALGAVQAFREIRRYLEIARRR